MGVDVELLGQVHLVAVLEVLGHLGLVLGDELAPVAGQDQRPLVVRLDVTSHRPVVVVDEVAVVRAPDLKER